MLPKIGGIGVAGGMSRKAEQELLAAIRERYRKSSKRDKTRILEEFITVTGHHREHGIRLLTQSGEDGKRAGLPRGRLIYDDAVREAAILIWEASDRQQPPSSV